MRRDLKILTSSWFLIGLAILLLNDFILKGYYGNWLTGKLSDFAGLFIFPIFWTAFFPRYKKQIFLLTALIFILWKSEFSSFLINYWNIVSWYNIGRVVDYTDLIALVSLPMAYYFHSRKNIIHLRFNPAFLAGLSFFAFASTSRIPDVVTFKNSPIVAYKKISDTMLLSNFNILHLINADTIQGYSTYQYGDNWFSKMQIAEFSDIIIFKIHAIELDYYRRFEDDFEKAKVKRNLSSTVLKPYVLRNLISESLIDELKTVNKLQLKTDCFGTLEELNFKDSKQHGVYNRFYKSGRLELSGSYRKGVENGMWTYYSNSGRIGLKQYYTLGELTKKERIIDGKIIETETMLLRREVIRNNIIALTFTIIVCISLIYLLIIRRNIIVYRESKKIMRVLTSIVYICTVPVLSVALTQLIKTYIPFFEDDIFPKGLYIIPFTFIVAAIISVIYFIVPRSFTNALLLMVVLILAFLSFEQALLIRDLME